MLHEVLSPLIKIDCIASKNASQFAHFRTRPVKLSSLPAQWGGTIYTSAFIKTVLRRSGCDKDVSIVALVPFSRQSVMLSDDSELSVVMLPTESAERNVMLLFELNDRRAFYSGGFTEYQSVLRSSWCQIDRPRYSGHFIHTVHVDNTVAGNTPTIPQVCDAIRDIVARHPGHRIRIPLPNVGYEDLLVALTRPPYEFVLTVGLMRHLLLRDYIQGRDANAPLVNFTADMRLARIVAVVEQATTAEEYAMYLRERIITVRLVPPLPTHTTTKPPKYHAAFGLYELTYTPHADAAQVLELVEHLRPGAVRGIYADTKMEEADPNVSELRLPLYEQRDRNNLRAVFGDEDEDDDEGEVERDGEKTDDGAATQLSKLRAPLYEQRDPNNLRAVFGDDEDEDDDEGAVDKEGEKTDDGAGSQLAVPVGLQSSVVSSSGLGGRSAVTPPPSSTANDTSWMNVTGDSSLSVADGSSICGDHSRLLRRRQPHQERTSKLLTAKRQRIVYEKL